MKIKFTIPTPDDTTTRYTTSCLVKCSLSIDNGGITQRRYHSIRPNQFGEFDIKVEKPTISTSFKVDPIHENIARKIDTFLLPKKRRIGYRQLFPTTAETWFMMITFRYKDGDSVMFIRRKNSSYYIDNVKVSRTQLGTILAQIFYFTCHNRSMEKLDAYIEKTIKLPYFVSYALENRTPYYFYHKGAKQEVRINTKLISETEGALEISEGIWASISIKDLNIFINTYLTGSSRSKTWHKISPERLWTKLLGTEPKSSEYHLMIEWLKQNRTDSMIQKRAFDLLNELCEEYEEFQLINFDGKKSIYIKGKLGDWVIVPKDGKSHKHQGVNTYLFENYGTNIEHTEPPNDIGYERSDSNNKTWRGPICIDNLHDNSSIGDQMAARAMLLKNDTMASKLIYTIRSYDFSKVQRINHTLVEWKEE